MLKLYCRTPCEQISSKWRIERSCGKSDFQNITDAYKPVKLRAAKSKMAQLEADDPTVNDVML